MQRDRNDDDGSINKRHWFLISAPVVFAGVGLGTLRRRPGFVFGGACMHAGGSREQF